MSVWKYELIMLRSCWKDWPLQWRLHKFLCDRYEHSSLFEPKTVYLKLKLKTTFLTLILNWSPHLTRCPPWGTPHLKMNPPIEKWTPSSPLENEALFQEMIPRKKSKYWKLPLIFVSLFLSATWLTQGKLWTIIEGKNLLTQC